MDDYLRAIVLGLIQALTEFLPISSSAHLLFAPALMGGDPNSLTFDVGLHVGTLVATLAYFWRDWTGMLRDGARDLARHGLRLGGWSWQGRLGLWIVIGSVPAVLVGAAFDHAIEQSGRSVSLAAVLLIVFGIGLGIADRLPVRFRRVEDVSAGHAVAIGLAQAVALMPGVSRSGVTITAARGLGFDRATAARFSFLLSIPATAGAAVLKLAEAARGDVSVQWGPMVLGAVVSGIAGAAVIHWLLRYVQTRTLIPFVVYRIAVGIVVLVFVAAGVI